MTLIDENIESGVRAVYRVCLAGCGFPVSHNLPTEELLKIILCFGVPAYKIITEWEFNAAGCDRLDSEGRKMIHAIAKRALGLWEIERKGAVK
jgi:hypothetical protein